jgi:hypothetical protein
MPRINVSEEELILLEKIRTKQSHTIGYNEGIEAIALQFEAGAYNTLIQVAGNVPRAMRESKRSLV